MMEVVRVKEAAKRLNVCTATIYRMIRDGDLKSRRLRKSGARRLHLIPIGEIERFTK